MPASAEHADATPLNIDIAESLIRKLTDGLVNIRDDNGEFLLRRKQATSPPVLTLIRPQSGRPKARVGELMVMGYSRC